MNRGISLNINKKINTIESFNKFAEQYATLTFTNILQYELNRFISLIPKKAEILDLACGSGRDVQYFIDYGLKPIGIDASKGIIREAKKMVPEGNFKVMQMEKLNFKEAMFDAIWALDAVSYLEKKNLKQLTKNLSNMLKDEGLMFISVRKGEGEKIIEHNKVGKEKIRISFFSHKELEEILVTNGFKILNSFEQEGEDFTWINIYAKKK